MIYVVVVTVAMLSALLVAASANEGPGALRDTLLDAWKARALVATTIEATGRTPRPSDFSTWADLDVRA